MTEPATIDLGSLAAVVTRDNWPTAEAAPMARTLTGTLGQVGERNRARITLILGVLAEKAPGARDAVRECLGSYLDLLAAAPCGSPEYLALLYLLAHFPENRPSIMAAAGKHANLTFGSESKLWHVTAIRRSR